MTTYTTQPSTQWPGYTDIIEHRPAHEGGPWRCGSVPNDRVEQELAHRHEHTQRFFQRIFDRRTDPQSLIAAGHAYWIGGLNDYPKGFGGRRWFIRFHSGRVAVTDSLWHQGLIPDEWRDRLPDNAMFSQLDVIVRRCTQCRQPASIFFNGRCRTCSGGLR